MPKFAKKVVVSLGNYESLALEVSECSSFIECDEILDTELAEFDLKHRGIRRTV